VSQKLCVVFLITFLIGCAIGPKVGEDKFAWLEKADDAKSLSWVENQNKQTVRELTVLPYYSKIEKEVRRIVLAEDRIPFVQVRKSWLYNFWQDAVSKRGVWRRVEAQNFTLKPVPWETLLDLDKLAQDEKENWVWAGTDCLAPQFNRCLIKLSRGGGDAVVVREFDIEAKSFVKGGFEVSEAKTKAEWKDLDHIWVATNEGAGSLTESNYPRRMRLWQRGTPLKSATLIYEVSKNDAAIDAVTVSRPESNLSFVVAEKNYYDSEIFWLTSGQKKVLVPKPLDAKWLCVFQNQIYFLLRSSLQQSKSAIPAGSIVKFKIDPLKETISSEADLVYTPPKRTSVQYLDGSRKHLYLVFLKIFLLKIFIFF
jgi:prolyl oligopeptidase